MSWRAVALAVALGGGLAVACATGASGNAQGSSAAETSATSSTVGATSGTALSTTTHDRVRDAYVSFVVDERLFVERGHQLRRERVHPNGLGRNLVHASIDVDVDGHDDELRGRDRTRRRRLIRNVLVWRGVRLGCVRWRLLPSYVCLLF